MKIQSYLFYRTLQQIVSLSTNVLWLEPTSIGIYIRMQSNKKYTNKWYLSVIILDEMWLSYKLSQIYKQYTCSNISLFVFHMKLDKINIIIYLQTFYYRSIQFIASIIALFKI